MAILKVYADSKGPGQCRSCCALITWAELVSGKRIPFDGREIVVVRTEGDLLGGKRVIEHVDMSITKTHFETCPNAAAHRRRR
jgi:hypothetical protein